MANPRSFLVPAEASFDGQIGPARAALILSELRAYAHLMAHGNPARARSWRTIADNELRAVVAHHGCGRTWSRLPLARFGDVLAKMAEMMCRARKIHREREREDDSLRASRL